MGRCRQKNNAVSFRFFFRRLDLSFARRTTLTIIDNYELAKLEDLIFLRNVRYDRIGNKRKDGRMPSFYYLKQAVGAEDNKQCISQSQTDDTHNDADLLHIRLLDQAGGVSKGIWRG